MKDSLGTVLRTTRQLKGFTLRQVEESIGISNAYLSQLENDKIKNPSANVLYKLSCFYCIPIDVLLIAAGIIKTEDAIKITKPNILNNIELTLNEQKQLLDYLKFLRTNKHNTNDTR